MDICLLCEKYLLFGETAERHLILYHKAVAPARCPCCSWTFRHGDYAINHNRMMLKKNGYNFTPLVINKYPPGHFVRNKKHFPQDFMKFLTELQDNAKTKVSVSFERLHTAIYYFFSYFSKIIRNISGNYRVSTRIF